MKPYSRRIQIPTATVIVSFLFCWAYMGNVVAAPIRPDIYACIKEASVRYEHDYSIMLAIAKQESSLRPSVVNKNPPTKKFPGGTDDIGLFQVNSGWLPVLRKYGITRASLFDPCVNAHVAGWIWWENKKMHGNTWKSVGAFNSPYPAKQREYIKRVWGHL